MTDPSHDLKRQLLRQAVDDNLAVRAGLPRAVPSASGAPSPPLRRWRRFAWLLLLPLLLLPFLPRAFRAVSTGNAASPPAADPAAAVAALEALAPPPAPDLSGRTFPAPQRIDAAILPLAVQRILLDPGHGGEDRGAVGDELLEKDLTLDIALRLRDRLRAAGFEVLTTRETDHAISLKERAQLANTQRADIFVSIHINWIETRRVRGVETYFLGPTEDPALAELARRENRQSGYSLSDLRRLLEGIYADVRQDESRTLAESVQRSLFRSLQPVNASLQDRGVKTAPFVVLVATEMPAILAEVSCLSNEEEATLLARPLYREHIAEALFQGIRGYADEVNQIEEKGS